jgi:hypothetical protein
MNKIALATSFAVLLINSSALAETWSVSERLVSGINYASGTWNLNMQGDKLTGKAEMQIDNGTMLHYSVDGTVTGGVYSVTLVGRDDDKKNCVWTGKTADGQGGKVIAGQAECEGTKLYIRGGVQ